MWHPLGGVGEDGTLRMSNEPARRLGSSKSTSVFPSARVAGSRASAPSLGSTPASTLGHNASRRPATTDAWGLSPPAGPLSVQDGTYQELIPTSSYAGPHPLPDSYPSPYPFQAYGDHLKSGSMLSTTSSIPGKRGDPWQGSSTLPALLKRRPPPASQLGMVCASDAHSSLHSPRATQHMRPPAGRKPYGAHRPPVDPRTGSPHPHAQPYIEDQRVVLKRNRSLEASLHRTASEMAELRLASQVWRAARGACSLLIACCPRRTHEDVAAPCVGRTVIGHS